MTQANHHFQIPLLGAASDSGQFVAESVISEMAEQLFNSELGCLSTKRNLRLVFEGCKPIAAHFLDDDFDEFSDDVNSAKWFHKGVTDGCCREMRNAKRVPDALICVAKSVLPKPTDGLIKQPIEARRAGTLTAGISWRVFIRAESVPVTSAGCLTSKRVVVKRPTGNPVRSAIHRFRDTVNDDWEYVIHTLLLHTF